MTISLTRYYPYRIDTIRASYNARAADLAKAMTVIRDRWTGTDVDDRLRALQRDEYGSLSNSDFAKRARLAQAVAVTTDRWDAGGRQILDLGIDFPLETPSRVKHPSLRVQEGQSLYVHLRTPGNDWDSDAAEGVYVTRVGEGSDETCLLGFVIGSPGTSVPKTLGQMLAEQSRVVFASVKSLGPSDELELIDGDPGLLGQLSVEGLLEDLIDAVDAPPEPLAVAAARRSNAR
ncbi:hypothetical protein E2F50_19305 [Rhizobium deserti]|uniref:Uncharacterized protein n=1 Tax=Rhizobium deserti TaxID=2547961 RepID=A0A4R5UAH6_9HYPH|nr:hypothetical protein [Rhizobium deserti]TDK31812.1 hypothetical protein E2F50_19305 [Rhizobium deserti]